MNVLHVITGLGDGGAEAVLFRLIAHDREDKHQVVSLTDEGKYGALLRERGVEVAALGMPRGWLTLRGLVKLWRTIHAAQSDVVQTWMYHADLVGGMLARLAGIPVVWGIHNTTLEPGQSSRVTIAVARLCARLSRWVPRRIVACAQAAVRVHAAMGYDPDRMVVISNGYDLTRFQPDAAARERWRATWKIPPGVPLIGMVARWDPYKDHANLLAALAAVRRAGVAFQAVLVGSGVTPDNPCLTAQIREAGLSGDVLLVGPQRDIPGVMAALDVHVLSSAAEAFPNVLAEAMACGTPCVTTDVGDAAAIVGETGWVVPPRDASALAAVIQQAIGAMADRAAWRARQQACRARITEHYGIDAMVQRYRAVWAVAAQGKGGAACVA
ncbi:glycosyltransferase [Tepidimonas taiwanensis]|uniref:Putative glycosyltransferase EpsF n=1 Tax=Tepidimonas taiwanensis TaxID=307486 RepID=A0A554X096_9BURK|nr:glycosyltransferase [Tepidimonas taiwanensis]TSE29269.1 putative glycosyltransferase EpsF [Tepidimonas taiwanensis]UBQ06155.1 glycosyltransferase [Tepidimonas taiwanensis]